MKELKKRKTLVNPKPLINMKSIKDTKKLKKAKENNQSKISIKTAKFLKNRIAGGKNSFKDSNEDKKYDKKKKNKSHKEELESLKDIDPEFYDFLKQNDKKLLDFNMFDSDDSDDENQGNDDKARNKTADEENEIKNNLGDSDSNDNEDSEMYHKPNGNLEVASDESDFEDDADDVPDGQQKVTLNLLRQWQVQLEKQNVSLDIVRKVIQAFSSALASITSDEGNTAPTSFKVVGSATFNGVVQLCVLHLYPALLRILGLTPRSTTPIHKTKKWTKVRGCLRYYLTDLIRLVEQVSSANILSVLLKHLHQMAVMTASFTTLGKTILKRLIVLWSTGDETIRVLAFLCILKITRNQQVSMLHHVLKAMYLSYVRNSKFVSPNTLPSINFMRRSLVEMFALDLNASYQHAFLYIRQLAIHLRNAVILKKKDSFQAVYNWQYVNSLRLWADLLGATTNKPQLQPLVYPLVTITLGVIRLIPTAQYFPLRFHCIKILITLAKETHAFIPLLPLILEVLRSNTFNRKHTVVSMRPIQFTCILRLNKGQLSENGFRDEVIEQVCSLVLELLANESATLAFSDLVVPTVLALKSYLKECRNGNYSRKLKQLLDKIQENSRFIDQERRKITFNLNDVAQVNAWETKVRNKGTPLSIYYESWVKTHEAKKRRQAAQIDSINADYDIPSIKRSSKDNVAIRNDNGELELFPSDSEDEEMPNTDIKERDNPPLRVKRIKKQKKPKQASASQPEDDIPLEEPDNPESVDIVKDLDLDDW
ncbi:PREDICTED: nucleolar complex protein 2 homolog [Rhagoletis zephyria]|uniref:nucleolar complex protein 2 homolog n=1 Tax=Rhagoletis zephyria TaxID=28612 RepID=UPI00081197AD|nr:PREDICTED: nucleolar complex protein 2 homolog [Rhagoletis zephyria]